MMGLLQIVVMLLVVGFCAYQRMAMKKAMIINAAALVVLWIHGGFTWGLFISLLIFAVVATFYLLPDLRIDWISRKAYLFMQKVLPPMNETEKTALEAGDVWWEGDLFRGNPDWNKMLTIAKPALTEEEQSFVDNETEELCSMLDDWDIVHKRKDLPPEVWQFIKDKGFLGMIIPKEYGGKGFSALAHSTVVTKIATRSGSAAVTVMVPNSLGPGELLLHYGTQEQKDYYLPRLAKGDEIPCFALTSPVAGSDAGAIPDKGIVCKGEYQGKEVLGIKLTWNKRYITLAPVATIVGLAFKLYDPDNLIGDKEDYGITCALIPADHPGVEIGQRHLPMNQAFMNGTTTGKDVFIPMDMLIGGQEFAGQGWRMLMESLAAGRSISLPAMGTAVAKLSYRMTGAYSLVREQFKTPIGRFEGVEEAMARIAGLAYRTEASRVMTAGAVDLGIKPSVVSAIAKYHMTEMGREIMNHSMDIHGGRAIIMGERNYLANGYMSQPIGITVEGANILTRNLMIFGQGAIRCHPYVFREMLAAQMEDTEEGVKRFDSLLFRHIGYGVSNFARTFALGLSASKFANKPVGGQTGKYYQHLTRMSSALALTSDIAMGILGGDLKRKERLSARLADVLSHLYMCSAVLKYYQDNDRPLADLPYVKWNMEYGLHKIQEAFYDFYENFPIKAVGKVLRFIAFPYGKSYSYPSDKLEQEIVKPMMQNCEIRDRITEYAYVGKTADDVTGRVELAFLKVLAADEVRRKLRKAMKAGELDKHATNMERIEQAIEKGIINQEEQQMLVDAEEARMDVIQVDDYSHEEISGVVEDKPKKKKGKSA
ncbi:acyl-CoA dehydrogenase [Kangiella profundi]|uniref:Acyl-coenzyme A dehydrogenase n=2 Tax=Kangiella profundi TaxID=1561924 RepID=A0A2K9AWU0_9GAMM|nr:acyl-CoA dehydrogenase [Kangiella profundi]AUD78389.1 acyl-CoA dehydrogenase [Kangiella profundi]GGF07542.1 acyl-CoA dehydrogenase [Kangiella profundi]